MKRIIDGKLINKLYKEDPTCLAIKEIEKHISLPINNTECIYDLLLMHYGGEYIGNDYAYHFLRGAMYSDSIMELYSNELIKIDDDKTIMTNKGSALIYLLLDLPWYIKT